MKKLFFVLPVLWVMSVASVVSAQVVILEEVPGDDCSMMLSGPCAPAPAPAPVVVRPRPARPRYAPPPVVAESPAVPPPPAGLPHAPASAWFPRWGVNFIYLATGDEQGELLGGGLNAEYMFSRHFGVEGSILGMGSSDDPYAPYRDGVRAGFSLLWFPNGIKTNGLSFYLRGGVVGESISTYADSYSTMEPLETRDTTYREVAAGLRYYIPLIQEYYAFSVGVEASALFDSHSGERENGEDRSTAAFRLTMGFHF